MEWSFEDRRFWFHDYVQRIESGATTPPRLGVRYPCPCCGYPTLEIQDRGYEICSLCGWEDDGQDDPYADDVWGGPNYELSLSQARSNFEQYLDKYQPEQAVARRVGGTNSPVEERAKREMIAAFDSMIGETAIQTLDALWEQVYASRQILYRALHQKIREYESRARKRQLGNS